MPLRFTKMHGLGNDFVVLDARSAPLSLSVEQVRAMADRRTGVGFDQLLIVEPARDGADFAYSIRNADGSSAQQCGNGVRCIAAWLRRDGALRVETARLQGPAGAVAVRFLDGGRVAVDMGEPVFDPARVPFAAQVEAESHALDVEGESVTIGAVSMGNPHAVIEVDEVNSARVDRLGPLVTAHSRFPQGANAGFAQVLSRDAIKLRVHERGAGWTRACGSGACAAMAVLRRQGRVDDRARVELPGGTLEIEWRGAGHPLWMTGPASFVFDGRTCGADDLP
ncbi:MAG TPA: diaminopimelate epimerase [Rhodanobacteraceae bacterium]|nr:diaminopimelate epimerase [Rhodanobacteraceae bacterium]